MWAEDVEGSMACRKGCRGAVKFGEVGRSGLALLASALVAAMLFDAPLLLDAGRCRAAVVIPLGAVPPCRICTLPALAAMATAWAVLKVAAGVWPCGGVRLAPPRARKTLRMRAAVRTSFSRERAASRAEFAPACLSRRALEGLRPRVEDGLEPRVSSSTAHPAAATGSSTGAAASLMAGLAPDSFAGLHPPPVSSHASS